MADGGWRMTDGQWPRKSRRSVIAHRPSVIGHLDQRDHARAEAPLIPYDASRRTRAMHRSEEPSHPRMNEPILPEPVFTTDAPAAAPAPASSPIADWAARVHAEINKVFIGQENLVKGVLAALLAEGHVLI